MISQPGPRPADASIPPPNGRCHDLGTYLSRRRKLPPNPFHASTTQLPILTPIHALRHNSTPSTPSTPFLRTTPASTASTTQSPPHPYPYPYHEKQNRKTTTMTSLTNPLRRQPRKTTYSVANNTRSRPRQHSKEGVRIIYDYWSIYQPSLTNVICMIVVRSTMRVAQATISKKTKRLV